MLGQMLTNAFDDQASDETLLTEIERLSDKMNELQEQLKTLSDRLKN